MSRLLFSLAIFWLASMPEIALESNPAGDWHLVESGFIGYDDFTDPTLAKWTIDAGVLGSDLTVEVGNGGSLRIHQVNVALRYTATPVSPTIVLPRALMQNTALESWNPLNRADDRDVVRGVVTAVTDAGTYYHFTANHMYFGMKVNYGYKPTSGGAILEGGIAGLVAGQGPDWLGVLVDPDGDTICPPSDMDCSGGGLNKHCSQAHSNDWACVDFGGSGGFCESANYGLTGWPGIRTWNQGGAAKDYCDFFEYWAWNGPSISVECVPTGHYIKAVQDASYPTSHPGHTLPGNTWQTPVAPAAPWVADGVGYTIPEFCLYSGNDALPPIQRLELWRDDSPDVLVNTIEPNVFQPGVLGGDRYTLCPALQGLCDPLSTTSFFFFGGGLAPLFRTRVRTSLDAVVAPVGTGLTKTVQLDAVLDTPATAPFVRSVNTVKGSGTNVVINAPPTIEDDDYLLFFATKHTSTSSWTGATGGLSIIRQDQEGPGTDRQAAIASKIVTDAGSEPATYQMSHGINNTNSGIILAIGGVDPSTPLDVAMTYAAPLDDATPQSPAITPITDNCLLILFGFQSNSDVTFVAPTNFDLEAANDGALTSSGAASKELPSAAPDGPFEWQNTGGAGSDDSQCYTLALRPA
jgi:hypothetical protein